MKTLNDDIQHYKTNQAISFTKEEKSHKKNRLIKILYIDKLDEASITFTIIFMTDWDSTETMVAYNETRTILEWIEEPPTVRLSPESGFSKIKEMYSTDNWSEIRLPYMVEWGFADGSWGLMPHETRNGLTLLSLSAALLISGLIGFIVMLKRMGQLA